MAYEMVMPYHLHMPSYFLETFTEYPSLIYSTVIIPHRMINGNSWNANIPSTLHTMIENDHKNRLYKISRQNPFHGSCRLIYVYGNPLSPRKANHPSRLSRQNLPVQREQHSWEETEHPVQQVPGHPHALLSTHGYC